MKNIGLTRDEKNIIRYVDSESKRLSQNLPTPSSQVHLVIIIPAKNESDHVLATLERLNEQRSVSKNSYEVLVLSHNSTDDTYLKVKSFFDHSDLPGFVFELTSSIACTVGAARRLLMNIACNRISAAQGFLISLDADTLPEKNWLFEISRFLNTEIDLVCGRIQASLDEISGQALKYQRLKDEFLHLKNKLFSQVFYEQHDPWPKHGYHWGPSLAITKKAYQSIGGCYPKHFLEDVDLFERAIAEGFLARHSNKVRVTTSTRTDPRCKEGFGAELRVWQQNDQIPYPVESGESLARRFQLYDQIRTFYREPSENLSTEIRKNGFLTKRKLNHILKQKRFSKGVFLMDRHLATSVTWNTKFPNIQVETAISQLKRKIREIAKNG